ncbi:hypothetical protein JEQ12_001517 [Ovis aries]|uniref:NmrA-like family domain-containing protein 1 n=1 Tax=Ovis aries TaxID=9940 RepID=A0A836AQS9_SHEEP|nr:hypothetical protein JEQ12_001517 [Ovis aries]
MVLRDLGAKVVEGDLNDKASVEAALKGAYGAFLVTNFWDHFSKEKEVCQGKVVADVAKSQGLKHVVYSGLENVKRLTNGKLEVLHFDRKGEVEEYFWSIGVPMTSVRVAAYFENFLGPLKPVKASDGDYYTLALPMGDVPMDGISVADIGAAVCSIFNSPEEFVGKAVGLSAEVLTIQQDADVLSKSLGKEVRDAKVNQLIKVQFLLGGKNLDFEDQGRIWKLVIYWSSLVVLDKCAVKPYTKLQPPVPLGMDRLSKISDCLCA